jgi:hypothetical protein
VNAKKQVLDMCPGKEICGVNLNGERGGHTLTAGNTLILCRKVTLMIS